MTVLAPGAHAVVVGASSQIGRAIAEALSERGLVVSGLARSAPSGAPYAAGFACDVALEGSATEALARAGERAPIDVLVYAAGAGAMGRTLDVPEEVAAGAFAVNFWGLDQCVRAVVPGMQTRRRGAVLAVLSLAALRAVPFEAYYAASKAAAARYLECLALELAASHVDVHYVAPGYIDTGFFERGGFHGMAPPTVRGSGTTPADVAQRAVALLEGRPRSPVLGWRERTIRFADRVAPGLYDRHLRRGLRRS